MSKGTEMATFLTEVPRHGDEISVTGRWVPSSPSGRFRTSPESQQLRSEWQDIHEAARSADGVLSTEVNHAVGADAVLVHHVFENADALTAYFATTAAAHLPALREIARPELQMVRGLTIPEHARDALRATGAPLAFGQWRFGYVKHDYRQPDPETAIQVTAKWTCTPGEESMVEQLEQWWARVGTDAHSLEEGLTRFEVYRVPDEDALIIHETFADTKELKFHLTKGTADRYKKDIDAIAAPEAYYFRGPVSSTIRTYSKFMHLPATYTSRGAAHTAGGGSLSDGLVHTDPPTEDR